MLKVVILAGGLGTRLAEETSLRPKPMVEIGGMPILWHIMKFYASWGYTDFVICLGYKGYAIKEYFANYFLHTSDVKLDLRNNRVEVLQSATEPWTVTMIDTGLFTMTGGRVKRILPYVDRQRFMLTYGDGLSNVDLKRLVDTHVRHGHVMTLTAVRPLARFGAVTLDDGQVSAFVEKPPGDNGFINGGFFVVEPSVENYIAGDDTILEREPMRRMVEDGVLGANVHDGFWHPMDTLRDAQHLNHLWESGAAPWKIW